MGWAERRVGWLLDELRLMVHPVVLGGREVLELVDSKTFGTGVVSLTHRPSSV
jgi:hypothetical protein